MTTLRVFTFTPDWGLPSAGPFAIKLLAWLVTPFYCPHCDEPHLLAGVQAWLGELRADQK